VKRALKSDHSADDEGARDPADDYEIVVTHERIFQLSKLTVSNATIKLRDDRSAARSLAVSNCLVARSAVLRRPRRC
jgi:hypothetical protein